MSSADGLALRGGLIVDPVTGTAEPLDLVLSGGRIAHVGPRGSVACETTLREVNLEGAYVVPGLVDAHAHVAGRLDHDSPGTSASNHLAAYLAAGVTTIRDAGAPGTAGITLARVTSAPVIHPAGRPIHRTGSGAAAAREARAVARSGAAWLKAYDLGAAELGQVIAVGLETGLRVGAHLGAEVAASIALGVEAVEHVYTLMRHDLVDDRMRRSPSIVDADRPLATWALATPFSGPEGAWYDLVGGTRLFLTPTLSVMRGLLGRSPEQREGIRPNEAPWATEWERRQWQRSLEGWGWWTPGPGSSQEFRQRALENLGHATVALASAGCQICVGTDFSQPLIPPGSGVVDEMLVLRDAGLSALDVLRAATVNPAALLGMQGEIGVIAVGARADLFVVGSHPLASLETLREPEMVVAEGRVVLDLCARRRRPNVDLPHGCGVSAWL